MDVKEAIMTRRAYRSFVPVTITRELVEDLAGAAGLAPSCNNNQPCRFVFVYGPEALGTFTRRSRKETGGQRTRPSSLRRLLKKKTTA